MQTRRGGFNIVSFVLYAAPGRYMKHSSPKPRPDLHMLGT